MLISICVRCLTDWGNWMGRVRYFVSRGDRGVTAAYAAKKCSVLTFDITSLCDRRVTVASAARKCSVLTFDKTSLCDRRVTVASAARKCSVLTFDITSLCDRRVNVASAARKCSVLTFAITSLCDRRVTVASAARKKTSPHLQTTNYLIYYKLFATLFIPSLRSETLKFNNNPSLQSVNRRYVSNCL